MREQDVWYGETGSTGTRNSTQFQLTLFVFDTRIIGILFCRDRAVHCIISQCFVYFPTNTARCDQTM